MIYTKLCLFALFVSLIHCQDAVVQSKIETTTTTKPTTTTKGVTTIEIDVLQIATSTMSKEEFSNLTVQEIIATHHNHTNHSRIQIENPIVDSHTASSTCVGCNNSSMILIVSLFSVTIVVVIAVILAVIITLKRRNSKNSFQINGDVTDSTDSVAKQAVVNKSSDGDNSGTPNGTTVDSAPTTATSTDQQHVTNNGCSDNGHENMVSTVDETKAPPQQQQQQQQESNTNTVSSSNDQIPNAKETDKLLSEQHQQQLIQNNQSNN